MDKKKNQNKDRISIEPAPSKADDDIQTAEVVLDTPEGKVLGQLQIHGRLYYSSRSGPLPTPEDLEQYADISKELVPQIVGMAVKEQEHRHELEKQAMDANIADTQDTRLIQKRGQLFALIIGLSVIAASATIAIFSNPWVGGFAGGSLGLSGVWTIVYAFLKRPRISSEQKETQNSDQELNSRS